MSILDYFRNAALKHQSKNQRNVEKVRAAYAGTKLVKYFAKAPGRGPRGY